jgi:hypothetical protein
VFCGLLLLLMFFEFFVLFALFGLFVLFCLKGLRYKTAKELVIMMIFVRRYILNLFIRTYFLAV